LVVDLGRPADLHVLQKKLQSIISCLLKKAFTKHRLRHVGEEKVDLA